MYKTIKDSLSQRQKYLIIGDLMLDQYIQGDVKRISPEAPVPVLKVNNRRDIPGGAGNVALNVAGLNAQVTVLGFTGNDSSEAILKKMFKEKNIELNAVHWDRETITKTRVMSGFHQIVRVDDEDLTVPSFEYLDKLQQTISSIDFTDYDGVILSDYAKGVCQPEVCKQVISLSNSAGIPVIVDPKGSSWDKYTGATILTPNLKELSDILGMDINNDDDTIKEAGLNTLKKYKLQNLIVTRSEKGMSLVNSSVVEHFPTMAKDVFDVSGAGDTVVAGVIRFLTSGLDINESITMANYAAGIVVGHVGTWAITKEEMLHRASDSMDIHKTIDELKKEHKTIVFTNGCFDILHQGHIDYMQKAKELGDYLIIGLNSDASVKRLKGDERPVNNQDVRKVMLEALSSVDAVEIFDEDTPYELIKKIQPDILVKGGDYKIEEIVGREFAKETLTIPFLEGFSTTSLIERIKKAYE